MHIAVVGAGISGLATAALLSRRHRVDLFEQERRLGGHTSTVLVDSPTGTVALDTGFLVHNDRTYPNWALGDDREVIEQIGIPAVVHEPAGHRDAALEHRAECEDPAGRIGPQPVVVGATDGRARLRLHHRTPR
jgi:cation diffusion facilitator CzcD-associated flavoprotein CzcO